MIAIIDNGATYSDRRMYFVACTTEEMAGLVAAFATIDWIYKYRVLATAEKIEWREPDTTITPCEMLDVVRASLTCPKCHGDDLYCDQVGACCNCGFTPSLENFIALAKEKSVPSQPTHRSP